MADLRVPTTEGDVMETYVDGLRTYVGRGPWRIIDGVSVEVWQEAPGTDGIPAYTYRVTEGAAVRYAAAQYREADAWLTATLDEWEKSEEYTAEQFQHVQAWYMLAIQAEAKALGHLMDVAREGER